MSPTDVLLLIFAPFVGSFLGVLVDRLPRDEPVTMDRSRCRSCGAELRVVDLVPLAGYAIARGRCRHCGGPIPGWLPAIELSAVGIALWAVAVVPWPAETVATALLGWLLLPLAVIDWRHMILPFALSVPVIVAGLAFAAGRSLGALTDALAGAILGGGVLWLVAWLYAWIRGREGLGFGDVVLLAGAGAWVGWQGLASVVLIASLSALLAALALGLRHRHSAMPFGTFLCFGLWITWVYGPIRFAA